MTPLWCMCQRMQSTGRSLEIFYSARSRSMMVCCSGSKSERLVLHL